MRNKKKGVVENIHMRQLGVVCYTRFNQNLLRNLVCESGGPTYIPRWETHSKTSIYYDYGRLYLNNYRTCFTICGFKGVPQILYRLPKVNRREKIKSCLCCHVKTNLIDRNNSFRSCLLAVAANGWMSRYDLDTGEVLQRIYLSSSHGFRHVSWETQGHSVVLKTILNTNRSQGIVCSFAIFKMFPMDFEAIIEISRTVFGNDVSDAMASDGLLVISHKKGSVKIYNLQSIIDNNVLYEAKLGEKCKALGGIVGEHPYGLPVNVHINECPPVLFEVKCGDNDLAVGGFPWQYIIQTIKNHNIFRVSTIEPPYDVKNGLLKYERIHIEPDRAIFHHDESGRIIHYSSTEFRCLKMVEAERTNTLQLVFRISFDNLLSKRPERLCTKYGRKIKRNSNFSYTDAAFQHSLISFHYEDDLDLLSILVADPLSSSYCEGRGSVNLYDNNDGTLIKSIILLEVWEEESEHNLILDCDVLIHIVKNPRSGSHCYVYALDRSSACKSETRDNNFFSSKETL